MSHGVQYTGNSQESNPLLNGPSRESPVVRYFWILFLTILFGVGSGIGFYLLFKEGTYLVRGIFGFTDSILKATYYRVTASVSTDRIESFKSFVILTNVFSLFKTSIYAITKLLKTN